MESPPLSTGLLLAAYAQGVFPMAEGRSDPGFQWFEARQRGVIPIESFHMSRNVLRIDKQKRFEVKVNTAFRKVMEACADRPETWINEVLIDAYTALHRAGFAHSVEVYERRRLVGGLYGVHINAAFFGESMFHVCPDADKLALLHCHRVLEAGRFRLWDTQMWTPHLAQFGCLEIPVPEYKRRLAYALEADATFTTL